MLVLSFPEYNKGSKCFCALITFGVILLVAIGENPSGTVCLNGLCPKLNVVSDQ